MLKKLKDKLLDIFLETFEFLLILGMGVGFGVGAYSIQPRVSFFAIGFLYGASLLFAVSSIFDSDKWTSKPLICAIIGALLTVAWGTLLGWSIINIFFAGIVGLILGYSAPLWGKYM